MSAENYASQLQALLPPGKAYDFEEDSALAGLLLGMADEFARLDASAFLLLDEASPITTSTMLPDWEFDYGLPDLCSGEIPPEDTRRKLLLEKINRLGEQTPQSFINLAALFGYEITITEFEPHTVNSNVNYPLYPPEIRFVWQVNSLSNSIRYATVNDDVNTPLAMWGNAILECIIRRAKPAHTHVQFSYENTEDALRVVYIGDSNTDFGFRARMRDGLFAGFRSDSLTLQAGDTATLTLYPDITAAFTATGDTIGPRVTIASEGFIYFPSGSPDQWCCFRMPGWVADAAAGAAEGGDTYPLSILTDIPARSDSHGLADISPSTFAQILSGQKFQPYVNLGISGDTTALVLPRIWQVSSIDSFGRSTLTSASVAVVMVGINDFNGEDDPLDLAAAANANLTAIRDAIVALGVVPVFCTLAFETDARAAYVDVVNAHILTLSDYVADIHAACDQNSLLILGPHFTPAGALIAGALIAEQLELIGTPGKGLASFRLGGAPENRVINGALNGAGGSLTNITGVAANSTVSTYTGAGTCVASKVSASANHDRQRYAITDAEAGDTLTVELDVISVPSQYMYSEVEIDITGDSVVSASHALVFTGDAQTDASHSCGNFSENEAATGLIRGVLRTRNIEVPPWTTSAKLIVTIVLAGGDTVIDLTNIGAAIESLNVESLPMFV